MNPIMGDQLRPPGGYGESLAVHLEQYAQQREAYDNLAAKTAARALRALAAYVRGLEAVLGGKSESQLLGAMWASQQRFAPGNVFSPGPKQTRMVAAIGASSPPMPQHLFDELVAVAIVDAADATLAQQQALANERARTEARLKVVPELEEKIGSLAAELDQTKAALADAQGELDELRDEVAFWRGEAELKGVERPGDDGDAVSVETSAGPVELVGRKRHRHPTEPNIYVRWSPKAQAAEWFAYRKADGYVKCGSEQDAIALRDAWTAPPAPEQVDAPTSDTARSLEEILE